MNKQLPSRMRNNKRYWWLAFILLFGTGSFLGWQKIFSGPRMGTIRQNTPATPAAVSLSAAREPYEGERMAFTYQGNFAIKTQESPGAGPVLERVFLYEKRGADKSIAWTLEERPLGQYESSPAFLYRDRKEAEFSREKLFLEGKEGILFTRRDAPYEKTFFFWQEGLLVTLSVTSLSSPDGLPDLLQGLVKDLVLTR